MMYYYDYDYDEFYLFVGLIALAVFLVLTIALAIQRYIEVKQWKDSFNNNKPFTPYKKSEEKPVKIKTEKVVTKKEETKTTNDMGKKKNRRNRSSAVFCPGKEKKSETTIKPMTENEAFGSLVSASKKLTSFTAREELDFVMAEKLTEYIIESEEEIGK